MKILLIYPYCLDRRSQEDDVRAVPIGVYYVGAMLRAHGYVVEILNWYELDRTPAGIRNVLADRKPDVIGCSILHANRWGGIEIARVAKDFNPEVKIVFGGIGATFLWKHLLTRFPEIDYIVLGEGELAFLKLVRSFEAGTDPDPSKLNIAGIAMRKEGQAVQVPPAPMISSLDSLPNPARYFTYQHLALTRGCPGKCTFCGSPAYWGPKVRFHSRDYFVDQLAHLYKRGVTFFYFSDDTFTLKKQLVIEICQEIIRRRLPIVWVAISRVNLVDEEVLLWMRKAGCVQISFGVESGSEDIRKLYCKGIQTGQIRRAFRLSTQYGILARAYFIYGAPGESSQTIQASLDLIDEIRPLAAIFYILDLFPGTALYEEFKNRSRIDDRIWDDRIEDIPYFETDPLLSRKSVLEFGDRLRRHFYRQLPAFAAGIELKDDHSLYPLHADFLSRLAMTFSHGDYARNPMIDAQEGYKTAALLYEKALTYHPDERAFLGLGILRQKQGRHLEAVKMLARGIEHYPHNQPLHMAIGISLMNSGQHARALDYLEKFDHSPEAERYISQCRHALKRKP
jgi:radical SAM superfamily enzyme YgiQ (UPF0313 family)